MTDAEIALASSWRKTTIRDKARAVPEVEFPLPEAGEEMDVSESTVCVDVPPARPAPTYQVGGSQVQVREHMQ